MNNIYKVNCNLKQKMKKDKLKIKKMEKS